MLSINKSRRILKGGPSRRRPVKMYNTMILDTQRAAKVVEVKGREAEGREAERGEVEQEEAIVVTNKEGTKVTTIVMMVEEQRALKLGGVQKEGEVKGGVVVIVMNKEVAKVVLQEAAQQLEAVRFNRQLFGYYCCYNGEFI